MKRLRFLSGEGNGSAIVVSGQILTISMVADPTLGSWMQVANSGVIFVPGGYPLCLEAADLGNCCGAKTCDQWPGDVQIEIVFGQLVQLPFRPPDEPDIRGAPLSWLVVYNGC